MRPLGAICKARGAISDPECVRNDGNIRVKAMVTDHREGLFRQGALSLQDMIQILWMRYVNGMLGEVGNLNTCLIVAPGEHDIVETTMRLVDAVVCRIDLVVRIWVCPKGLGVYDFV